MLTSSFQIYNLQRLIQEFNLQLLNVFKEIGSGFSKENDKNSQMFSDLLFLVRDWQNPKQFDHGLEGDNEYVGRIKEGLNDEQRHVRQHAFDQIGGFLLPHPGFGVATDDMSKVIGEVGIGKEFMNYVELLFRIMVQRLKETNGKLDEDLFTFMENISNKIPGNDVSISTSLSEDLATKVNNQSLKKVKECYREKIREHTKKLENLINGKNDANNDATGEIERIHNEAADAALHLFETHKTFNQRG